MQIFRFSSQEQIKKIMHDIGVDAYWIKIMLPKALSFLIRLNSVSNIAANILKQEMLSLGGDVALARGALTGKTKKTDCLIISELNQINSLIHKIRLQPFGLKELANEIKENIRNFTNNNFNLRLGKHSLNLGKRTHIMGIINLTPDSFSGDGLYSNKCNNYPWLALEKAKQLVKDGVDIIDLGGQSSRPRAKNISAKEEILRTIPVVKLLAKELNTPISIDTVKPEVACVAIEAGAQMINDISGLKDKRMIKVAAKYKAAVVIMHMLGNPRNMQRIITYQSLINDIVTYLQLAIQRAESGGIKPEKIIIDPGIGFGKKLEHNLEIINRLSEFKVLGKPILLGPSRKSFIARILGENMQARTLGTVAASVMAAERGANILRVHDVKEVSQALKILSAVNKNDCA